VELTLLKLDQNINFCISLVFEGLFALYHFQSHVGFGHFVKRSQNLPKRSFPNTPSHHVSLNDFFTGFNDIIMIPISPSRFALIDSSP
jgi:hypothetical protein